MANHVNFQQTNVIFIDLEEEDDDGIIELLPPNTNSHSKQNVQQNKTDQKIIIQQCLALLLHAQRCDIIQEEKSEVQIQCIQPQCSTVKDLLKHQGICKEGQNCTIQHCRTFRMILKHWNNCTKEHCQLCSPLRHKFKIQLPSSEAKGSSNSTNQELLEPDNDTDDIPFSSPFPSFSSSTELNSSSQNNNLVLNIFASSLTKVSEQRDSESTPLNPHPIIPSQPENQTPTNPEVKIPTSNCNRNSRNVAFPRWRTYPNRITYHRSSNSRSNSNRSFKNQQNRNFFSGQRRDSRSNRQCRQTDDKTKTQYQVMMLIHACKCQKREEQNIGPHCTSQACKVTKTLLDHVKVCGNTVRCTFQRCISSKRLLLHLNQCIKEDCSLCSPLRKKCYAFWKARENSSNSN